MGTEIYTIGYGNRDFEDFLGLLKRYEIAFLVDVRSKPYSHYKTEYTQANLKNLLKKHGIRYVFMGDLIGARPEDPSCYENGRVNYELVRTKAFFKQGIERLLKALSQDLCLTLMCAEMKPDTCHRCHLIAPTLQEHGVTLRHIDQSGEVMTQAEALHRHTGGQMSLF